MCIKTQKRIEEKSHFKIQKIFQKAKNFKKTLIKKIIQNAFYKVVEKVYINEKAM